MKSVVLDDKHSLVLGPEAPPPPPRRRLWENSPAVGGGSVTLLCVTKLLLGPTL